MNPRRFLFAVILFSLFMNLFSSCSKTEKDGSFDLGDSFYWAYASEDENVIDTEKRLAAFSKFESHNGRNIARIAGSRGMYVWLRSVFSIPDELKGKSLGLVIPHLHFAAEIYINGNYAGSMGKMPPHERPQMHSAGCFTFPVGVLYQNGGNELMIKVLSRGRSSISEHVYLTDMDSAKDLANKYSAFNSRIYLNFEGGMCAVVILFFLIFIQQKSRREYLYFAIINFTSMIFLQPFYSWEMPWSLTADIPYIWYFKLFICIPCCVISYFITSFLLSYMKISEPKIVFRIRLALLALTLAGCIVSPTYDFLMRISPYILFVIVVQICFGFAAAIIQIYRKTNVRQNLLLLCDFLPFIVSIVLDFILKEGLWLFDQPYYTVFGWQGTIIAFLLALTINFTKISVRSEYLNQNLMREVDIQTRHLSVAMEKLEHEKKRSDLDMEMAAIVQQKFFPYPSKKFRGWDIATSYSPVSKVSGDLYDYYHGFEDDGTDMQGFSLFDVSGHGISSGLITMLSKDIIFRAFQKSVLRNSSLSQALYEINDQIIDAKGDIENYLTGIMFRIGDFDQNDECKIEFANAGHPNPILFSAKSKIIADISQDQQHYGAIGIKDIAINFPQLDFTMGNDDILVCYTDGLTEAMNSKREQFGVERVKQIVRENYAKSAQSILEELIDGLYDFIGDTPREDDMTIMVLKREDSRNFIEEL